MHQAHLCIFCCSKTQGLRVDESQLVAGVPTHRLIETSLDYWSTVLQHYKYVAETLCFIHILDTAHLKLGPAQTGRYK
jgi:hypothetical protein